MARIAIAAICLFIGVRIMTQPKLKHFSAWEFRAWYPSMSPDLLRKLDAFREAWGDTVDISPASGSIGRMTGSTQHNVVMWLEVRGIDVIPKGMDTAAERARAYQIAVEVGFTGIGVYPDWLPSGGLHLDVRKDREAGDPAKWAGLKDEDGKQYYTDIEKGFA